MGVLILSFRVFLVMPDLSRAKVEALAMLSGELPLSILVSYSTFKLKPTTLDRLRELRGRAEVTVMLDSGAYHLRRLGLSVSVGDYAGFAKTYSRLFDLVVAPDVPGDAPSTVARTLEFRRVYDDWFLPVTQGSSIGEYLWCLGELEREGLVYGYVGVGGLDGPRRTPGFLGELLNSLCNSSLRLHLFGLGARLYKTLSRRFNRCIASVDTGAWQAEIRYRRRTVLGANGDMVDVEYKAMRKYLERFNLKDT